MDSKVFDPLQDENVVFSAPSIRAQYHVQCSAFNQNKGETSVGLSHSACFDRVSSCHEDEKNAVVRVAYPARAHPPLECGRRLRESTGRLYTRRIEASAAVSADSTMPLPRPFAVTAIPLSITLLMSRHCLA